MDKTSVELLVRNTVSSIVDDPSEISIDISSSQKGTLYEVRVGKNDIGKVIGKDGKIASALRTLAKAAGAKNGEKVMVNVINTVVWFLLKDKYNSKEKSMFKKALRAANRRAKKKSIPFDIEYADIVNIFERQDGKCFYSGLKLNIVKADKDNLHDPYKMSLDCLEPKYGYIKTNIVLCLYCINSFKQKMNKNEMMDICSKMLEKNLSNI